MKRKFFLATALTLAFLGSYTSNAYAYSVRGAASLVRIGTTGSSYDLLCNGPVGTCYTNNGTVLEVYLTTGNRFFYMNTNPTLVPNGDGTYTQFGPVTVTEL